MELILSLDTNWAKKGFWLKLIGILKEEKSRHLLNVLSRYNRLFIDDIQKRGEYRAAIEEFGNIGHPVSEYWLDTISFEFQFVGQESAYQLIQKILTSMVQSSKIPAELGTLVRQGNSFEDTFEFYKELFLNVDLNLVPEQQRMITQIPRKIVHFQNPSNQQLCFRNPLIRYILKNSKAKTLRNFFQTCKYFYAFQSTPICYRFSLQTNSTFSMKQESLFLSENEINNFAMSNFYVSNYFTCISENPRIFSQIIPKIYKSDAEYYNIQNQVIYLEELEKLIPFQSAKTLSLLNCSIIDRNDAIINHPTILNMFLKQNK
uniref:Uncharacterized protein n=1 Tax=Panagrolaimus davidi TaxID=227884 RepID=A0A914PXL1_9BILA